MDKQLDDNLISNLQQKTYYPLLYQHPIKA